MAELDRRLGGAGLLLACVLALLFAAPGARAAEFGIGSFTATAGSSQAGAHADLSTSFALATDAVGNPIGGIKGMRVELPPGVVGNPLATERCTFRSLEAAGCSNGSQVGVFMLSFIACRGIATSLTATAAAGATVLEVGNTEGMCEEEQSEGDVLTIGSGASAETVRVAHPLTRNTVELTAPIEREHAVGEAVTHVAKPIEGPLPLYNLAPFPGHVATFGSFLLGVTILVQVDIAPDGRLVASLEDASTLLPLAGGGVTLWGVPADPSHDPQRCNEFLSECGPTTAPAAAFMTLPTECSGQPLESVLTLESWNGQVATRAATQPAPTGCDRLTVEPSLRVRPETTEADTPAGYEVELTVPQRAEPYGLGTPALKGIAVKLPEGTSLSPAFAVGLEACSEAQLDAARCPNASRVGAAEVLTPLLGEPLQGSVYFGTPTATERYPLLVQVSGKAVSIHFAGRAEPDPRTGQVTAVFEDAPALPFKQLRLSLFGGPSGALDNPRSCGQATSTAAIVAYGGATAAPSSAFTVSGNCGAPFAPSFVAGTKLPRAASYSPFSMTLSRADGEPDLGTFSAQLPPGLTGLMRSMPLCAEPRAAAGECDAGSRVGTATVGVGAGSSPLYLSGPVYLTGPYGDAPFGLAAVIHAAAGPVDLGDVVVRTRLYVEPGTFALRIATDSLPRIVGGVPLRMRSLNVTLDKPEFIVNPSNCGAHEITGTAVSAGGASHPLSTPFSVLGCNGLRFAPRVSASTGAHRSARGNGAGLAVRISPGGATRANMKLVSITLPSALRPRLSTIQGACLPGTAPLEAACSSSSIVGDATVTTPALAQPLSGYAYLVAHGGAAKPTLALVLHGGGITDQLDGTLTISRNHVIKTTFAALPDVPIEAMSLNLRRGPHSMLGSVGDLCATPQKLAYAITDQAGRSTRSVARIAVPGCARKKAKK